MNLRENREGEYMGAVGEKKREGEMTLLSFNVEK